MKYINDRRLNPMNKYEIRTANKKSAIMEATLALINENGLSAASMKQIANRANVSPVSIYNYYGSKENLVLECIQYIFTENFKTARNILESDLPFEKKLTNALSLCTDNTAVSLSEYFSTISLAEKDFIRIIDKGQREIQRNLYRDFIEEGKKEGAIDTSIPTQTILKFFDSINNIPLDPDHLKSEIHHLHNLLLHGILIH